MPAAHNTDIVDRIRRCNAELVRYDVAELRLFGSHARGDARADSDIDLLVRFRAKASFDQYMGLKLFLEDTLGRPVDLVSEVGLNQKLRERIDAEAVRVA